MIHPSDKWRFVEPFGDKGFFEDDVVQHIVTEHRALRRAMSDRVTADAGCLEEVKQQATLAATYNAPALPRIYAVEMVKGRLTVIMELVTGASLEDEINHQKFVRPYDWASFACKLVDELLELRQSGTRFHKLGAEHLVLQDSGDVRITSRWPVGTVQPPALDASPLLQRMVEQPRVGVYTSTAPPNEAGEIEAVKQIFTRMAAGSVRHSFEELRDEAKKAPNMHPSPLAGIDPSIARILMGMHPRPEGSGEFTNLFNVQSAVKRLCEDELRRMADVQANAASMGAAALHQSTPVTNMYAGQGNGPDSQMVRTSSANVPMYRDPVTGAPKDPVTGSYREVTSALRDAAAQSAPSRDHESHSSAQRPAHHGPGEDHNPYAAPPTMAHAPGTLHYPPVKDPISGATRRDSKSGSARAGSASTDAINPYAAAQKDEDSGPVLDVGGRQSREVAYRPPSNLGKRFLPVIIGVAALVIVAAGVFFLLPMLKSKPPNTKPVAIVAPLTKDTVNVNELITLDASGSKDQENDQLTYYWEKKSPADGRVSLMVNGTNEGGEKTEFATQSARIDAQFFTSGDFSFQLKVGDGQTFSDPITVNVKVVPKN
ncbi:MAG: hypothetical protein ABI579_02345 [Candidatus Sumerlaeota bacterium]